MCKERRPSPAGLGAREKNTKGPAAFRQGPKETGGKDQLNVTPVWRRAWSIRRMVSSVHRW